MSNTRDKVADLDSMNPAAHAALLGTSMDELANAYNDLAGRFNALVAKLNADAGVANDYTSAIGNADTVTPVSSR